MGRRHLSLTAALVAAAALAVPAGAAVTWSELSRGVGRGGSLKAPLGFIAYQRSQTAGFAKRVPGARARIWTVDFRHRAVVAVVGEFGCQDPRVSVQSMTQARSTLVVTLKEWPLAKGQVECDALFPTYRLLTIGKAELNRPYPTRVDVRLARA